MKGLSDDRHSEICTMLHETLADPTLTPAEAEQAYISHITAAFDRFHQTDRTARRRDKHILLSTLNKLEAQARELKRASPHKQAIQAQTHRVKQKLQQHLDTEQRALARQYEQRRWRQEQSDSRALFNSIKPDKVINLPLDELRIPTHVDEEGQQQYHTVHGQHDVAMGCKNHWQGLFNHGDEPEEDAMRELLRPLEQDPTCHLLPEQQAQLTPAALFTPENVSLAMDEINKGTMPGGTGITVDLVAHRPWREAMSKHVSRLCMHMFTNSKELLPHMKEAIISVLYKGKGLPRDLCKSHRPVSLTDATCRIIDKVIQTALNKVMPTVLCGINKAFLPGERMEHSTLSLAEAARYADRHGGGAIVGLDLLAAYDRCVVPFLKHTMRAMQFPDVFIEGIIGTMYKDNWARLKVNGHVGDAFKQTNGLRQGLPSSCPLWLIYVEPLVRRMRDDRRLRGITVPGPLGKGTEQLKCSAFADDVNGYCADGADVTYLLTDPHGPVKLMERASVQRVSVDKLTITLLGSMTSAPRPSVPVKKWVEYGTDEADKCLGIRVAKTPQVATQWFEKVADVQKMAMDVTAGRRLAGCIYARSRLAKGAFASKVIHTFKVQCPHEKARETALARLQDTLNQLVFGNFYNITVATSTQPPSDCGVGHLDVSRRLEAEWAHLVTYLMSSEAAVWKNIWWYELRQVYGDLCDLDMPLTTLTYKLLALSPGPSQVQQVAMAGWAKLRLTPAAHVLPALSAHGAKRHELAAYSGESIDTQKIWKAQVSVTTGAHAADQRLWFNACLVVDGHQPSRMAAPSTCVTELEALDWAKQHLVRFRDVINGTRVIGDRAFRTTYPTLDASLVHTARTDMPLAWHNALMDMTHLQRGPPEAYLPRGLLDDADMEQQHYAVVYEPTLIDRSIQPVRSLRVSHIYNAFTAAAFRMPRVFDASQGERARHLHLFSHLSPADRRHHIAQAVKRVKCSAVPPEMTETAYNVLMSAFAFGPSKKGIAHRDLCPCGRAAETVDHTFQGCARSKRLWGMLLHQWRTVTGESKLKATDGRVVLLGDRTGQWLDEAEQAEFAGLEAPFAIMHKAALHLIKQERDKDAACRNPGRPRRTAAQLYQMVAAAYARIVRERWYDARARRHTDSGKAMVAFRRQWESPGLVCIPTDGQPPELLLFLSDAARNRYKTKRDSLRSRHFRNQRYAPPVHLPERTVSIFTDGSAMPRKLGQLFPPAGWGLVAVTRGHGHEHKQGKELLRACGPVPPGTPNVTTATNNSAELLAFTRALQWARTDTQGGTPICMRYDSCYAAMVASSSWKAKAHKALAAEARTAWLRLQQHTHNKLWLRHVRGHSNHEWNNIADTMANLGRSGKRVFKPAPPTL